MAAALEAILTAELAEDDPSFTYRQLGERLARIKAEKDAADKAAEKRLLALQGIADEAAKTKEEPFRLNLTQPGEYGLYTVLREFSANKNEAYLSNCARRMVAHLRGNQLLMSGWSNSLVITCGSRPRTMLATSLENWLRKEARQSIEKNVADVAARVNRSPKRIYIMGQRTKWGNCSALGNLSFNWRLIMAPEFVLRYIVTHEVVHLAIPDHSQRFWLTVRSLCPSSERARQWLAANAHKLTVDLRMLF